MYTSISVVNCKAIWMVLSLYPVKRQKFFPMPPSPHQIWILPSLSMLFRSFIPELKELSKPSLRSMDVWGTCIKLVKKGVIFHWNEPNLNLRTNIAMPMAKKITYNYLGFDTFYCMDEITSQLNSPTLYIASWSKGLHKRLDVVEVQGLLWSRLGSSQKCQAGSYFCQKHLLHSEYIHSFNVDIFGTDKERFVVCTIVSLLTRLHLWPKPTISKSSSHYLVWHIGTDSLKECAAFMFCPEDGGRSFATTWVMGYQNYMV
jgi:hypothetical protein